MCWREKFTVLIFCLHVWHAPTVSGTLADLRGFSHIRDFDARTLRLSPLRSHKLLMHDSHKLPCLIVAQRYFCRAPPAALLEQTSGVSHIPLLLITDNQCTHQYDHQFARGLQATIEEKPQRKQTFRNHREDLCIS